MIVLDTHALVWWLHEPARLSARAQQALAREDGIFVPSIVFWEVAMLARDKRVDLGRDVREWVRFVQSMSRVEVAPLTPEIAVDAVRLDMHADLADRFIAATALSLDAALVTKDSKIRQVTGLRSIW